MGQLKSAVNCSADSSGNATRDSSDKGSGAAVDNEVGLPSPTALRITNSALRVASASVVVTHNLTGRRSARSISGQIQ